MKTVDTRRMIAAWLTQAHVHRLETEGSAISRQVAYLETISPPCDPLAGGTTPPAGVVERGPEPYPDPSPVPGPCPFPTYPQSNTDEPALHATGEKRS
jgi:hypothetical protein